MGFKRSTEDLDIKRQIRAGLIILILLLTPSGEGFSKGVESTKLQNEIYFPLIFNSLVNKLPPTKTPKPTQTRTPTRTRVPFRSSTPRPTSTQTPTQTLTPTVTRTPTYTPTTTLIPFPEITIEYPSQTPSITPSPTRTQTVTPSPTPQPGFFPITTSTARIILVGLIVLWIALVIWLYYFPTD
jgi:hypothetical protein